MNRRARMLYCAIASKEVNVALRAGGGFREPASMYVRCEERDCQFVDENRPPCPLQPGMFDDGSEQRLARQLQGHAGSRFCYACLTEALGVTHDQVRRASWRLKDEVGVSIRPARCVVCHRRGVTIGVGKAATVTVTEHPEPDAPEDTRSARVIAFLAGAGGAAFCAACVALSTELGLGDARRILHEIGQTPAFEDLEATCSACGRWQRVVRSRATELADEASLE